MADRIDTPVVERPARRGPGSRPVAVVAVLVGAGAVVACAGRAWAQVTVAGVPGPDVVSADGRLVAPGTTALALVAGAGAIVLATSGRALRMVVAALLVLAGAGVVALSLAVIADPAGAVAPAVAKATGTTGAPVPAGAHATVWPAVSGVGGVLVAFGGGIGLIRGRRWRGPSRRFERPGVEGAQGTKVTGPVAAGAPHPVPVGKDERLDAWDRLSQGEDPTD